MEQNSIGLSNNAHVELNLSTEELDRHLTAYLELLDQYNKCFEELQTHMKAAFFDLTKAKIALGPLRVGPNSYNLTSHLPTKAIIIQDQSDLNKHDRRIDQSEVKSELSFMLSSNLFEYQASTKVKPSSSSGVNSIKANLASDSKLRKRKPAQTTDIYPNSPTAKSEQTQVRDSDEEEEHDHVTQQLPDPIYQFSALPPPSLRSAQAGFTRSLESIVKLSNLRLKLFEFERLVQFYKPKPL